MRRLLTADPVFWLIVDAESHLLQCSAPTIIRTGTLEFIARSHQTRIPSMFREEQEIATYQRALETIMRSSQEACQDRSLIDLSNISKTELRIALYQSVVLTLEKSREKLFKRTRPHIKSVTTPQ